jgi:lipopolysaccharide/colanic/teichoic acid biosynthesis glycosyltransferase
MIRVRSPSSRGKFRFRLSIFDIFWALVSPLLALFFREAYILSTDVWATVLYCAVTFVCSLIAFSALRIQDGMSRYFSVHDAIQIMKAVLAAELMSGIVLFTLTRLEGIPRGAPVMHALILAAGLVMARTFVRMSKNGRVATPTSHAAAEHIIMIGSTPLTLLYMKFLEAYSSERFKIIAVLDPNPSQVGRAIGGVRIVGPPDHLQHVVDEFVEHGMQVNRVIVGGDTDLLPEDVLVDLQRACDRREIRLDFVPRLIGLNETPTMQPEAVQGNRKDPRRTFVVLPRYFQAKRIIDFVAASLMILLLLPLLIVVIGLVFLDVGSPVLFWQQRLGLGGRAFLLQKFRTLRPPFDWRGQPISLEDRLSWIGKLLRNLRLDELPQLLNVLVGDMSLIGPRPLLPHDQPTNPSIRLIVRPGITGWAQVNGATLLTPEQKDNLDEWYISNASLWLDLRILLMTFLFMFRSAQQSEQARAEVPSARIAGFEANVNSLRTNVAYREQGVTLQRRKEPRSKIAGVRS